MDHDRRSPWRSIRIRPLTSISPGNSKFPVVKKTFRNNREEIWNFNVMKLRSFTDHTQKGFPNNYSAPDRLNNYSKSQTPWSESPIPARITKFFQSFSRTFSEGVRPITPTLIGPSFTDLLSFGTRWVSMSFRETLNILWRLEVP